MEIPTFRADALDGPLLERLAKHLEAGGLLGYPTESVYGLGAAATNEGVAAVRAIKGREAEKPFILLVPSGSDEALKGLERNEDARSLAAKFWPGPLTLVLADRESRFPEGVRSGRGGVAVRVSSDPFVAALQAVFNAPLLSTSANRSGGVPAYAAQDLQTLAGRPGSDRLWIVDGGIRNSNLPSTIVDLTGARPTVVRRGLVTTSDLARVVPEIDEQLLRPTSGDRNVHRSGARG